MAGGPLIMSFCMGDHHFNSSQHIEFYELFEGQRGSLSLFMCWDCYDGKNRVKN